MRVIVLVLLGLFVLSSCKKEGSVEPIDKDGVPVITFVHEGGLSVDPAIENPSIEVSITCENKLSFVKIIRVDGSLTNAVWQTTEFNDPTSYTYNAPVNINENTTGVTVEAVDIYNQTVEAGIEITIKTDDPVEPEPIGELDAFPGAEGFGRYTTGGRGGKVYYVTTLSDVGTEGSLRYAINQEGVRTILFKVSGTIALNSPLKITKGDVTIAGQSAPGDGICLKNYEILIDADNVIIRFIRARLGDDKDREADAMGGRYHSNIIIDHCSMSWSVDECVSFYSNENTTVQWCLIAESLKNSVHVKDAHGYGGIWGGKNGSFHHNLLAHHSSRTPRFGPGISTQGQEMVDFRNNVFYNWSGNGCYGGEAMKINMVNNFYKPGPATPNGSKRGRIYAADKKTGLSSGDDYYPINDVWGEFYVEGNVVDASTSSGSDVTVCNNATNDNWTYGIYNQIDSKYSITATEKESMRITSSLETGVITTYSASEAYQQVLDYVGCSLVRDAVDLRIIEETKNGTATYAGSISGDEGIIDTPLDVGGYPVLESTDAPVDSDEDGMPDEWETAKSLNPQDSSDGKIKSLDVNYTNLEMYLNGIVTGMVL